MTFLLFNSVKTNFLYIIYQIDTHMSNVGMSQYAIVKNLIS